METKGGEGAFGTLYVYISPRTQGVQIFLAKHLIQR